MRSRRPEAYPTNSGTREERAPRSRRSLSPHEVERSRRGLGRDRRSTSIEMRDYARRFDGGREDGGRVRSPSPPFGQSRKRSQFDEDFPRRDSLTTEFRKKYQFTESLDLTVAPSSSLKHFGSSALTNRITKEDFHGRGSSALDGNGISVRKSIYPEEGTQPSFYKLPPDAGPTLNPGKIGSNYSTSASSGYLKIGLGKDEDLWYHDRLRPEVSARESYKKEENAMFSSRDIACSTVPLSHSKDLGGTSSSLLKDEFRGPYQNRLPFDHDKYSRAAPFDTGRNPGLHRKDTISYQPGSHNLVAAGRHDYNYPELGRRDRDAAYQSDDIYRKMLPSGRADYDHRDQLGADYMVNSQTESSHRSLRETGFWDHPSLQGEPHPDYLGMNRVPLTTEKKREFVGPRSAQVDFGTRVYGDHEMSRLGVDYGFGRGAHSGLYKEGLKNPSVSDVSPQRVLKTDELGIYDASGIVAKRKYSMDEEMSGHGSRIPFSSKRSTSSRVQELVDSDEQWSGKNRSGLLHSKRLSFGHFPSRKAGRSFARIAHRKFLATDDRLPAQDLAGHVQGHRIESSIRGGGKISVKKRLRPGPSNFHNPFRHDFHKSYKYLKRNHDDLHGGMNVHDDEQPKDQPNSVKSDPPKDSEEFKQLVHKAFLKFAKQLNENPAHWRRYKEQGKASILRCSVCRSLSKDFIDTQSLAAHAWMSPKVGLRAEHLGLHKAICVFMGWNSSVALDSSWNPQVLPDAEALAVKEDLILWPPLVIIHNSSIGNKNPEGRKIVTIEEMEAKLRGVPL
ncbi:PREDICTED: uncharacterized protein LOC104587843 isoform X2 [Nelumbo nucifera]|uniref:Uncharacterized protein LOC104587843 isoform X2 n=1 Tax=Nelumbo nucifera TaxID=4432 RepID=A0A1U7YWU7_NELNU|nr:PREDICTED: uncharacterized protein LOC104587843 isoform X2 [Nelumbo nucifera]